MLTLAITGMAIGVVVTAISELGAAIFDTVIGWQTRRESAATTELRQSVEERRGSLP